MNRVDTYLYDCIYNQLDYNFAEEYFATHYTPYSGGCSSFRVGKYYCRNLDWFYDNLVDFVVRVPSTSTTYATIGVAGTIAGLDKSAVEYGNYSELYKILPFRIVDGINEKGLAGNVNVVPYEQSFGHTTHTNLGKQRMNFLMLLRYLLDHCDSVQSAIDTIDNLDIYIPQEVGYESHIMLADTNRTVVIEFKNNQAKIIDSWLMTNFYLFDTTTTSSGIDFSTVTDYGEGLERYNLILANQDNSREGLWKLMKDTRFTNAYRDISIPWLTEFTGNGITIHDTEELTSKYISAKNAFPDRQRDATFWQTVHSSMYNMENYELEVNVQEQDNPDGTPVVHKFGFTKPVDFSGNPVNNLVSIESLLREILNKLSK